jgi:hypothetical protein
VRHGGDSLGKAVLENGVEHGRVAVNEHAVEALGDDLWDPVRGRFRRDCLRLVEDVAQADDGPAAHLGESIERALELAVHPERVLVDEQHVWLKGSHGRGKQVRAQPAHTRRRHRQPPCGVVTVAELAEGRKPEEVDVRRDRARRANRRGNEEPRSRAERRIALEAPLSPLLPRPGAPSPMILHNSV